MDEPYHVTAANNPHPPRPRAPCSEPSLLRRSSMEDADSSLTRKRPRLDTGDRRARSMSADRVLATSTSDSQDSSPVQVCFPEAKRDQTANLTTPLPPTPSRVTINLRSQSVPQQLQQTDEAETSASSHDQQADEGDNDSTHPPTKTNDSPLGDQPSPPVEFIELDSVQPEDSVAELNLDDDIPAEECAPPLSAREYIMLLQMQGYPPIDVVREMTNIFEKEDKVNPELVQHLVTWLQDQREPFEERFDDWDVLYTQHSQLWDAIGFLMMKLIARRYRFEGRRASELVQNIIPDLIEAYVSLVPRLIQLDVWRLRRLPADTTEVFLVSNRALKVITQILPYPQGKIWKSLSDHGFLPAARLHNRVSHLFTAAPAHGMKCLTQMSAELVKRVPIAQSLEYPLICCLECIEGLSTTAKSLYEQTRQLPEIWIFALDSAYEYFCGLDKEMHDAVGGALSALADNHLRELVERPATILSNLITARMDLAGTLFSEIVGDSISCDLRHYSNLVPRVWEIKTLKKYISKGRMGQRVASIEIMCEHLVQVYQQYNQVEGAQSTVMQLLADVLLEERIINYIVSVDSHPQLISRSGNILGFLMVTSRWSDTEMDAVWNAITTSPDPRVHAAIVQMLSSILNLTGMPQLLYICQKLSDLAPENFTPDLLTLMHTVLEHIRIDKQSHWASHDSKMNPYHLCVSLIKKTYAMKHSRADLNNVFQSASTQLSLLASDERVTMRESSAEERAILYEECALDISKQSSDAAASMHAIHLMISNEKVSALESIVERLNLTKTIIEELCFFIRAVHDSAMSNASIKDGIDTRFTLLGFLISKRPDSVPVEMYGPFWDHALGVHAINNETRDLVWRSLIEIARKLQHAHDLLDVCIAQNIAKLEPENYTPNLLSFLSEYAAYQLRLRIISGAADEALEFPALDLMWRVVLTALPNTIECETAGLLASSCCASRFLDRIALKEVEAAQVSVVQKCIQELSNAFDEALSSETDQDISIDDFLANPEIRYQRVFLILSELLEQVRRSPRFAPSPVLRPKPFVTVTEPVQGTPLNVACQIVGSKNPIPNTILHAGDLETRQQFYHRLERLSGSSNFGVIWSGQRVNLLEDATMTLREMGAVCRGNLILQVRPNNKSIANSVAEASRALGCSAIEQEILENFDKIYGFMDSPDQIAVTAYKFLAKFSPSKEMRSCILSATQASEIFPRGRVYKMSYHVACLKAELEEQTSKHTIDSQFILHGVQTLTTALTDEGLMDVSSAQHHNVIALTLEALLAFLEERPSPNVSDQYFSEPGSLVSRLVSLLTSFIHTPPTQAVACSSYKLLLKASQHSREVWSAFNQTAGLEELHYELLTHGEEQVRKQVANVVLSSCLPKTLESCIDPSEVVKFYWQIFCPVIQRAVADSADSPQLFEVLVKVFEDANRSEPDESTLHSYLSDWSNGLLAHEHAEFVGRFDIDLVVLGLSNLLILCARYLKSFKKPLKQFELAQNIFRKFLFVPSVLDELDSDHHENDFPVLEDSSRTKLYALVHALCDDASDRHIMLRMNKELYQSSIEHCSWFTDRTKVLRSSNGFVGVRNLGNTCYMNSLITQLFMNVEFRRFMLAEHVADETGQQRLLAQTQTLFAFMQNSYHKSADATTLAESIHTFDSQQIDVSIQMDVEEFFNLLFDQWEGQMLSPESKQSFRSFYGGNLIQQVKSKECEHVSERDEGFFTIQCEVKGKANLAESLKAYVEGDVMEGGNKYKCESCGGRLVDAVKRTCLKKIPDHLIFHLKRFDWDLLTGQRNKVNDYFEFPDYIDMTPYTIDYLSGDGQDIDEDMFELVGVLVHKGYAEHGHYFSYIRIRPDTAQNTSSWVKFDDSDVTDFNAAELRDCCFGGWDNVKDPRYAEYQDSTMKGHNAYMLFYQRRSSLQAEPQGVTLSRLNPAMVPVPKPLEHLIEDINRTVLRDYGLLSPQHTDFLQGLIKDQHRYDGCSEDHLLERETIHLLLLHLCRVSSRTKDLPQYEDVLNLLRRITQECSHCAILAIVQLGQVICALPDLMIKSPHQKVRVSISRFIYDTMNRMRKESPQEYGIEFSDSESESTYEMSDNSMLLLTVEFLRQLMDDIPSFPRAWDDYFDLLLHIATLGYQEAFAIVQARILERCLEKLHQWQDEREELQNTNFLSKLMVRKKPSYNKMIELVIVLLQCIDFGDALVSHRSWDLVDHTKKTFPITDAEAMHLLAGSTAFSRQQTATVTIANVIQLWQRRQQDEPFLPGMLIGLLLEADSSNALEISAPLGWTINSFLSEEPLADLDAWMEAVVSFCEHSDRRLLAWCERLIRAVIKNTAVAVKSPNEPQNGLGHRVFFYKICNVPCNRLEEPDYLHRLVISSVKSWGMNLLMFEDVDERNQAAELLRLLIFNKPAVASAEVATDLEGTRAQAVRDLLIQCRQKLQFAFQKEESRRRYQPMLETLRAGRLWLSALDNSTVPSAQNLKLGADHDLLNGVLTIESHLDATWQMDDDELVASEWADSLGTESDEMADYS